MQTNLIQRARDIAADVCAETGGDAGFVQYLREGAYDNEREIKIALAALRAPPANSFQNGNSSDGLKAPTPPALSEAEMAQLVAEDEAADRRAEAWDRAKDIQDRNEGIAA